MKVQTVTVEIHEKRELTMNHTPGPYVIGQPGGPAGPFWSIVNQQGTVIAMQITSEADAKAIVEGLNLLNQGEQPQLDWDKATSRLADMEIVYSALPDGAGRFGLVLTIWPLKGRLEKGERTKWLYDEIMEVK